MRFIKSFHTPSPSPCAGGDNGIWVPWVPSAQPTLDYAPFGVDPVLTWPVLPPTGPPSWASLPMTTTPVTPPDTPALPLTGHSDRVVTPLVGPSRRRNKRPREEDEDEEEGREKKNLKAKHWCEPCKMHINGDTRTWKTRHEATATHRTNMGLPVERPFQCHFCEVKTRALGTKSRSTPSCDSRTVVLPATRTFVLPKASTDPLVPAHAPVVHCNLPPLRTTAATPPLALSLLSLTVLWCSRPFRLASTGVRGIALQPAGGDSDLPIGDTWEGGATHDVDIPAGAVVEVPAVLFRLLCTVGVRVSSRLQSDAK
ncbi:hypothetical protein B0H21DRAFT_881345 [Amylocystis lapponica]|nr:hypothetical protein B0H21DRAFT_881345 [Amylocystis lapponica]